MPKKSTGSRVRAPVQVYLDRRDRDLLEEVAKTTGLSRAEVLRRGLRSIAEQALAERAPRYSLEGLVGSLGDDANLPRDVAENHDEYLYGAAGSAWPLPTTATSKSPGFDSYEGSTAVPPCFDRWLFER